MHHNTEDIEQNMFTKGGINQIRADKNGVMAALNNWQSLLQTLTERAF
jgi:hypothetical protein